jgi:hypothetical protein
MGNPGQYELLRDKILDQYNSKTTHCAFKDPRTLLTLPFWVGAKASFQFIGTFRHPVAVAHSLHTRDAAITLEDGISLWQRFNSILLRLLEEHAFPLINFDLSNP